MPAQLNRSRVVQLDPQLDHPGRRCVGADPDAFFPRDYERTPLLLQRMTDTALAYCASCPIRDRCRRIGEQSGYGLWGGVLYLAPSTLATSARRTIHLLGPNREGRRG